MFTFWGCFCWLIYIFWGLDDLYQAGFLRSLLGLLAACSVDPTLDGGSQGASPMTDHIHLVWCDGCKEYVEPSWMPKTIPKCLVLVIFLFHFGSWFEICEQERWRMWIRKMTPGTLCISCQLCSKFWKVLFWLWPRAQMIWPKHRPWRIRRLGECTFMHGRFVGRTQHALCCLAMDLRHSPFLVTLPDTIWWQGHWPKRCPPSHLSLPSHICRPDQLLFFGCLGEQKFVNIGRFST